MKKETSVRAVSVSKQIAFTALFAALCCVCTMFTKIPLLNGYFHAGDAFVILAGWFLGPLYGAVAAGLGSALADVFLSYASFAPYTFFIKACDAIVAWAIWYLLKKCIKSRKLDMIPRVISALAGEVVVCLGYFLVEIFMFDFSYAITELVTINLPQALVGFVCALLLIAALYNIKYVRNFFPAMCPEPKAVKEKSEEPASAEIAATENPASEADEKKE